MKILKGQYPPNIEEIRSAFPVSKDVVYAYGDTIFAPEIEGEVPLDVIVHEEAHQRQQAGDPETWWRRYLAEPSFRFEQETEAYAVQYLHVRRIAGDKVGKDCLFDLATSLSSPLYQAGVALHEAESAIRHKAKELA